MVNIDAPGKMKSWFELNRNAFVEKGIAAKLQLPEELERINKAGIDLIKDTLLASLTLWGNGMIEFLVVDKHTGETLRSTDIESKSDRESSLIMDHFLIDFQSLQIE